MRMGVALSTRTASTSSAILHFTGTEGNYIDIYINN
jgi:hypothetical protein